MNEILHHLSGDYTLPIRDPVWKNIYLSPQFKNCSPQKLFSGWEG